MKKILTEESVLFISLLKWFVLAAIIGIIVGTSSTIFLKLLDWGIGIGEMSRRTYLFLPFSLFVSSLLIKVFAPESKGHGTEKVLEAYHKRSGKMDIKVAPVKLVATVITIATGGSAGKEGPAAQIGSVLAAKFADIFRFNDRERKRLVICGLSAGFAAVFGTPIAGAIFGLEVLVAGIIVNEDLLPSFVAGVVSFQVASFLGISYTYSHIPIAFQFDHSMLLIILVAGLFFGLCSLYFIEILELFKRMADKIKIWEPFKGLIGGVLLVGLVFLFSSRYLGLGVETIEATMRGESVVWYAFLLKGLFVAITINFGGSGGVITPIFFIGATAGTAFAALFNQDVALFAAIGSVSLLAGATNTPIASSIMAIELFGSDIAPYAAMSCVISFLMTGHRCVYPSQILGIRKSMSLNVDIGLDMKKIETTLQSRDRTIVKAIMRKFLQFKRSDDGNEADGE